MAHISPPASVSVAALNMRAKTLTEPLFKKSPVFAMAQQKGQMKYNQGGKGLAWPVRYRRREITAGGSPLAAIFPEVNRVLEATLPWRVYELAEAMSKYSSLALKNDPNSYINGFDQVMEWVLDDFNVSLAKKVYKDGAASGSLDIYGFESLFNATAVAVNARVGTPTGTYAGLTQTLAAYGGSWTAEVDETWPTGWGSDQYRFWAPLQIDLSNTKWTNATKDWTNNWQEQITWALAMMETLNDEPPDAILLTPHMMTQAKQGVLNNQKFELTQNKDTIEAGVKAMTVEGIEFIKDARITDGAGAGVAYATTWDKMEINCMGSQLIETDSDLDLTTKNRRTNLDSHLQMKFEAPPYFAKFHALT